MLQNIANIISRTADGGAGYLQADGEYLLPCQQGVPTFLLSTATFQLTGGTYLGVGTPLSGVGTPGPR